MLSLRHFADYASPPLAAISPLPMMPPPPPPPLFSIAAASFRRGPLRHLAALSRRAFFDG